MPKQEEPTAPPLQGCSLRWIKWSDLLRRVFLTEALVCQLCGGERRVVAQIEEGPVARKILEHLGLPTTAPVRTPARGQAQTEFWDTGPPEPAPPEAPEVDFDQRLPDSALFA